MEFIESDKTESGSLIGYPRPVLFLQTSCTVSRRVFPLKFGDRQFGTLSEKENIEQRNYRLSKINNDITLLVLARRKRRSRESTIECSNSR